MVLNDIAGLTSALLAAAAEAQGLREQAHTLRNQIVANAARADDAEQDAATWEAQFDREHSVADQQIARALATEVERDEARALLARCLPLLPEAMFISARWEHAAENLLRDIRAAMPEEG